MNRLITVVAIAMLALTAIGTIGQAVQAQSQLRQAQQAALEDDINAVFERPSKTQLRGIEAGPSDSPIAVVGDSIYIAWPTNRTGNDEVNFRASTDGGITFTDKINLSNSTGAESQDLEIAADGDNVIITWWERNQTTEEPVARISSDNGATFGPLLRLASNGTIGTGEPSQ